jgi:hypothetical protein
MGIDKLYAPVLAPGFKIAQPDGSHSDILSARVTLTTAQLEAMYATPVSVLPAPGSGFAIVVEQIQLEIIAGGTAFTAGGAIEFVYHGTSTNPVNGSVPAADLTGASGTTLIGLGPAAVNNGTTIPAGTGVDITNATQAFASGNGSAIVLIQYRMVQL